MHSLCPFLEDSFILYNMPFIPALSVLADKRGVRLAWR